MASHDLELRALRRLVTWTAKVINPRWTTMEILLYLERAGLVRRVGRNHLHGPVWCLTGEGHAALVEQPA